MAKFIIWLCNKFPWATNLQDDIMSYYLLKSIFNSFCRYFRWHFSRIGAKEMTSCHSFKSSTFQVVCQKPSSTSSSSSSRNYFSRNLCGNSTEGCCYSKNFSRAKKFRKNKSRWCFSTPYHAELLPFKLLVVSLAAKKFLFEFQIDANWKTNDDGRVSDECAITGWLTQATIARS